MVCLAALAQLASDAALRRGDLAAVAANLAGVDGADPGAENRELAAFPRVDGSLASVASLPAGLGAWFDDHFGFRSLLVRWYGESRLFVLHISPSAAVIKGEHGWFFYGDDKSVEDYANSRTDDRRGAGQLARGDLARARLAARAQHRLRLYRRARQARHLRRRDAGRAGPGRRAVAHRSAADGDTGHRTRRRRPRRQSSRRRRASASTSRPIRTGTIAARWSRISGSSTRCVPGCRARRPPGRERTSPRRSARSKGSISPA